MRQVAFTFDMDNLNVIGEFYGAPIQEEEALRALYRLAGERLLGLLREFDAQGVFFVVGRDLCYPEAVEFYQKAQAQGVEIGLHGHQHLFDKASLGDPEKLRSDLLEGGETIQRLLGVRPLGYRGPGMQIARRLLDELPRQGYLYDSSELPTVLNFFIWTMGFLQTFRLRNLPRISDLFALFHQKQAYQTERDGLPLVRIPVSVDPVFQLPLYATLHLLKPWTFDLGYRVLSRYSERLIYQGHLLDFLDPATDPVPQSLRRYPLFQVPLEKRMQTYRHIFQTIGTRYQPTTLRAISESLTQRNPS